MNRVKVRCIYPRKAFFEKVLVEWKETIEDRNFRFVVSKAYTNLKNFPLEVGTLKELKNVKGIGDYLAQKLESAWDSFCSQRVAVPEVSDVKALKKGEVFQFLDSVPSTSGASTSKDSGEAAERPPAAKRKRTQALQLPLSRDGVNSREKINEGQEKFSGEQEIRILTESDSQPSVSVQAEVQQAEKVNEAESVDDTEALFHYSFVEQHAEVVLLVDNRENLSGRRGHSICEHFAKMDFPFEMRSLSVGDYMWILRLHDGTEIVLDYIVERKTFDDLSKSIRQGRYEEQKQRLLAIGLRHVVYVVEGLGVPDAAIEQALATTHVTNGFLVHRTSNIKETAQFLSAITKRLTDKAKSHNELGMTFEAFQKNAKKTQRRCVRDIFLRQLTVCPQMSAPKAALIVDRFPTLAALAEFYASAPPENRETLLSENIPGINKTLSRQLSKFFEAV